MSLLDYKDIAKIFEEIELRLIASLKRNLKRHKAEEKKVGFDYPAWQAEKLRNIEKFRRENREIMSEYTDLIDCETRKLMEEQFREGESLVESEISEESPVFFGVNEQKMQSLISDITTLEKNVETAALRMTDDIYRQTVNRVQLAMGAGQATLTESLDLAVKDFLDKGINCIVYSDGRRVNIADYVRMALRTNSTRANLQGQGKRFAELGYDTVMTSQYSACSKTCEPWQGQVYIDDVFTIWEGEHDEYQGRSNYCGEWFWLLSYAVKNGLFHPNCRHTLGQYIHGVTKIPEPIPTEEINRRRELEQKQRRLEREMRKCDRFIIGSFSQETVNQYKVRKRALQKQMRVLISANGDVLKRKSENERISVAEKGYLTKKSVDISEKSGIIKESRKTPITQITEKSIDRVPNMKIEGYSQEQCDIIQNQHKELLEYSKANNNHKEVAFVFDSDLKNRKEFLGEDDRLDFGGALYGKDLFVMHNHPRNSSYSDTDIAFLLGQDNIRSLSIVKNNGSVEILTKSSAFDKEKAMLEFKRSYKKHVKTGKDIEIDKAVNKFISKYKEGLLWIISQ